jgi:hypothetical protein
VRQLFLERAEPRGIDRHAFLLYRGGLPSRAARSLSSGVFFRHLQRHDALLRGWSCVDDEACLGQST